MIACQWCVNGITFPSSPPPPCPDKSRQDAVFICCGCTSGIRITNLREDGSPVPSWLGWYEPWAQPLNALLVHAYLVPLHCWFPMTWAQHTHAYTQAHLSLAHALCRYLVWTTPQLPSMVASQGCLIYPACLCLGKKTSIQNCLLLPHLACPFSRFTTF